MHKICIYKISIKKNNQRDTTLRESNQKQPLLYATSCPDLIHIPKSCMKIALTVTELWRIQECLKKLIKGAYLETKKVGTIILVRGQVVMT